MEEEIDLKEIVRLLWLRKFWIIGMIFFMICVAIGYNMFMVTPVYESSATVVVNGKKGFNAQELAASLDLGTINANQKIVITYGEIIKSRAVLIRVINYLALDLTYDELYAKISATPVNETEILKITVTDENPDMAALIANTTGDIFISEVIRILKVDNVEYIDRAIVSQKPINVHPSRTIVIFSFFGALVGVFVVFLSFVLDSRIKSVEDLEKYLGVPIWGAIPNYDHLKID